MRLLPFVLFFGAILCQAQQPDARSTTIAIGEKFHKATQYSFEGELILAGQQGKDPAKQLAHAKVAFASAPDGKYVMRIEPEGKDAYLLMSNGSKSWATVPKLRQYTEEEVSPVEANDEDEAQDDERDIAEDYVRKVVPVLAAIHTTGEAADFHGEVKLRIGEHKGSWPLMRVSSKLDEHQARHLTQLVLDPKTLEIGRMIWSTVEGKEDRKTVIELLINFTKISTDALPDSTFTFDPPKNAKRVDALALPGRTGSLLLNRPAPDFEAKTLDGEKVRLADFHGSPVLLTFWATWCPPCRRELPGLAKLYEEYKPKGLVVLSVNDEGRGTAKKFLEKTPLPFPVLDDSALKLHRSYRIRAIPTVFLIDKNGTVVRFLLGGREPDEFRQALATLGL